MSGCPFSVDYERFTAGDPAPVLARYREDFSTDNKPVFDAGHRRGSGDGVGQGVVRERGSGRAAAAAEREP